MPERYFYHRIKGWMPKQHRLHFAAVEPFSIQQMLLDCISFRYSIDQVSVANA
jgi:hypothetical protein